MGRGGTSDRSTVVSLNRWHPRARVILQLQGATEARTVGVEGPWVVVMLGELTTLDESHRLQVK